MGSTQPGNAGDLASGHAGNSELAAHRGHLGCVLSAAAMARGRPRPQNDMWIAAVCVTLGMPLATLNLKDFTDFEAYHGLRIITA